MVMPTHAMSDAVGHCLERAHHVRVGADLLRIVLAPAGLGVDLLVLHLVRCQGLEDAIADDAVEDERVDVVPWSIAPTSLGAMADPDAFALRELDLTPHGA